MKRLARAVLIALAASPGTGWAAVPLRVHLPAQDQVVSGGGLVHVVVEVDPGVAPGSVQVRLGGSGLPRGPTKARAGGQAVLHFAARLAPGPNEIEILLGDPARPSARETRQVFYHEPVLTQETLAPAFRPASFHRPEGERACSECHRLAPAPDDAQPPAPQASTCYGCHAALTRVKEVHGPAALWACTRCHDPASSPARYETPRPVMALCFSCHQEQKNAFYGNPYQHGPTATGYCTLCHNPHGSEHGFFLKKATWNLCTTCHVEKADGRHVVSWGPGGQTHPTRNRPDPSRVGKPLTCASCHNPHAAPGAKLWNFGAVRWLDLCRNCHPSIFGG